jgi:hypothetical protein
MFYVVIIILLSLFAWPLRTVLRWEAQGPKAGGSPSYVSAVLGLSDRLVVLIFYTALFLGFQVIYLAGDLGPWLAGASPVGGPPGGHAGDAGVHAHVHVGGAPEAASDLNATSVQLSRPKQEQAATLPGSNMSAPIALLSHSAAHSAARRLAAQGWDRFVGGPDGLFGSLAHYCAHSFGLAALVSLHVYLRRRADGALTWLLLAYIYLPIICFPVRMAYGPQMVNLYLLGFVSQAHPFAGSAAFAHFVRAYWLLFVPLLILLSMPTLYGRCDIYPPEFLWERIRWYASEAIFQVRARIAPASRPHRARIAPASRPHRARIAPAC